MKTHTFPGGNDWYEYESEEEAEAHQTALAVVSGVIESSPESIDIARQFLKGKLTRERRLAFQRTRQSRSVDSRV